MVIDDVEKRIHFLNAKCVRNFEKCSRNFPSSEVDKSLTFLDELIHKNSTLLECNRVLAEAVAEVWGCLERDHFTLYLHVCSNQSALVQSEKRRIQLNLEAKRIGLEEHHLQTFAEESPRTIQASRRRLNFSGEKIERALPEARTITGFVSIPEMARFLSNGDNLLDRTLFHANIRDFLGNQTPINREIAKSLFNSERNLFECLNNGIKVVCERMVTAGGAQPVHLTNAQIVNGLQTAHVLFDYAKSEPEKAQDANVLVHVTETRDTDLVKKIALATNSQQRIGPIDLRANDTLQLKLERELRKKGFRYLRKQGEISDAPISQTIDSLRLAQIILAYFLNFPEKAKTANSFLGDLYDDVFDPKIISSDVVISLHALYRLIESKKQMAKIIQRKAARDDYSEEWIIEGIFHVLYATKLFCLGNGLNPSNFDDTKSFIDDAIETISACFEKASAPAYRFFRLVGTRNVIEAAVKLQLSRPRSGDTRFCDDRQGDLFKQ